MRRWQVRSSRLLAALALTLLVVAVYVAARFKEMPLIILGLRFEIGRLASRREVARANRARRFGGVAGGFNSRACYGLRSVEAQPKPKMFLQAFSAGSQAWTRKALADCVAGSSPALTV